MEEGKDSPVSEREERANWTPEQDLCLSTFVNTYGPHNWQAISQLMATRFPENHLSTKQCRERWWNKLDPSINHAQWTKQEEAMLILAHMKFKNRWCDITKALKGRNNNMIKNRFYSIFRKMKSKVKSKDFQYTTKLELLEIHYMVSVIEEYASTPIPPEDLNRKRGKDFVYTLIEDVNTTQLAEYKALLAKRCPLKVPIETSLKEIIDFEQAQTAKNNVASIPIPQTGEPHDYLPNYMNSIPHCFTPEPHSQTFTLPMPNSFVPKDWLSQEEKEFVKQHAFSPQKKDPISSGTPMQMSPYPRMIFPQQAPIARGYVSSGGLANYAHSMKGGFAEFSNGTYSQFRPAMPPNVFVQQRMNQIQMPMNSPGYPMQHSGN
jgi:hypothetical protein